MDWNDIRLLAEVGRAGSFAAAAALMSVNPATVSRRAAALETQAGTALFRRTQMGASLTPAGEALLARALRIEEEVVDFEEALRAAGHDSGRPVAVRTSEGAATFLLTPAIAGQALGPVGEAAVRERIALPPMKLLSPLQGEEADIELSWVSAGGVPRRANSDRVRKVADVRFTPFEAGRRPPGGDGPRAPDRFEDLAAHRLISLDQYSWFQDERSFAPWNRLVEGAANPVVTGWTASLGHMVQSGSGIGLLPTYTGMYGDVRPVDMPVPFMGAGLWLCASPEKLRDRAVRRCYDSLAHLLTRADWHPTGESS